MRWEHAATAPDQLTAEMWRTSLHEEGIPAVIEPRDTISFLGFSSLPCRLLVPAEMLDQAKELLLGFGEADAGDSAIA